INQPIARLSSKETTLGVERKPKTAKQFQRKGKLKKLYEVYFNGRKSNFDRVSATSKKEAEAKMAKLYPNDKVTGSILIG
ncbi:MAG: hypothetical protein WCJ03_13280, partial [Bacteroidales bacterium]